MTKQKQTRDFWDTARIGKDNDKRRKLTDDDKEYIKRLHSDGNSIHAISRIFAGICSRRLIQLVIFPERYNAILARAKEVKRYQAYNDADHRREYMRTYRKHIREVHNITSKPKKYK